MHKHLKLIASKAFQRTIGCVPTMYRLPSALSA
jgi:hypothetical protein